MTTPPSNPGWNFGYRPSPGEWANAFSAKVDFPAPVDQGGSGAQTASGANYNILQRALISSTPFNLSPMTQYGVQTSIGALTLNLPALDTLALGDWIDLTDIDYLAGTNNVTIVANGSDLIYETIASAGSQVLDVDGETAYLIVNNGSWRLSLGSGSPVALAVGSNVYWICVAMINNSQYQTFLNDATLGDPNQQGVAQWTRPGGRIVSGDAGWTILKNALSLTSLQTDNLLLQADTLASAGFDPSEDFIQNLLTLTIAALGQTNGASRIGTANGSNVQAQLDLLFGIVGGTQPWPNLPDTGRGDTAPASGSDLAFFKSGAINVAT